MKKITTLLSTFSIVFLTYGQPTVQPNVSTELCPETNVLLTFQGLASGASNWTIQATSLKGCTVISNLNSNGEATVKFSDKKEAHEFALYYSIGQTTHKFTYSKIKTIDGLKPTWASPVPPVITPIPPDYDDSFNNFPPTAPCATTTFSYTVPTVKYKDAQNTEFGTGMAFYEWLLPKGWQLNGITSNGVNGITASSPSASITPDLLNTGEIKCRAKNNCDVNNLKTSNWYRILISNRPPLKLTMSGNSPIQCGDITQRVFTLENAPSCVTSYVWNLGADNGWLYQGNPAPATITTTTSNSIILTPVCGSTPKNVSVTPYLNSTASGAFTVSVGVTSPANLTINGSSEICSSEIYYIPDLPCGANVQWSAAPQGVIALVVSGNAVTANKLINGIITLTATITGVCGNTIVLNKFITVGAPAINNMTITNDIGTNWHWCYTHMNNGFTLTSNDYNLAEIEVLSFPSMTVLSTYSGSSSPEGAYNQLIMPGLPPPQGLYALRARNQNTCGNGDWFGMIVQSIDCINPLGPSSPAFNIKVSPNPIKGTAMIITIDRENQTVKALGKNETIAIELFSFYSLQAIKQWKFKNIQQQFRLNVSDIKKGMYVLVVSKGKHQQAHKITIE